MHLGKCCRLHKRLLALGLHIRILIRRNCESCVVGRGQNGACLIHAEECVTLGDVHWSCHAVTTYEALVKDKQYEVIESYIPTNAILYTIPY